MKGRIFSMMMNHLYLLIGISIVLRILVIALSPYLGDVVNAEHIARRLLTTGVVYGPNNPYPPLTIYYYAGVLVISQLIHIPFLYVSKILPFLADVLTMFLLLKELKKKWTVLLYALNPLIILISCAFGKEEPFIILLAFLSFLYVKKKPIQSALMISLSICLKTFTVLLIPSFILALKKRRTQVWYLAISFLPVFFIILPFVFSDYANVQKYYFSYSGLADYGWLAIFKTMSAIRSGTSINEGPLISQISLVSSLSKYLFLFSYSVLLWYCYKTKKSLLSQVVLIFLLFYVLIGGVGTNFLYWIIPFLLLYDAASAFWYTVFSSFAACGYLFTQFYQPVLRHIPFILFKSPVYGNIMYLVGLVILYTYCILLMRQVLRQN